MPASSDSLPTLYSVTEVAKALSVSPKTVRRWIETGELIAHRFGRQIRISEPNLLSFIRQRRES